MLLMFYFKFKIPNNADGTVVTYSPGWCGTRDKCALNEKALLYNDKERWGIGHAEGDFIPPDVDIIDEKTALALIAEAKDGPEVFTGEKLAHRWDTPIKPEPVKPDDINHKGEACLYKSNQTCQQGYCASCWLFLQLSTTPKTNNGSMAFWCNECQHVYTVNYSLPVELIAANINLSVTCPKGHKGTISIKSSIASEEKL